MLKERKLLRQQLEQLAEQSKLAHVCELPSISSAMCEVYRELRRTTILLCTFYSVVGLELLIYFVILIKQLVGG